MGVVEDVVAEHGALEPLSLAWETYSRRIDEPARRVTGTSPAEKVRWGRHHRGGVGAGDSDTLVFQGRDGLGDPGGDGPPRWRRAPGGVPPLPRGLGGVWVNDWPRIRPLAWLTWRARSRSKPVSMLSAAASSSEVLTALRVWGMVLAAPAMTAASLASILALPGVRSAMRLMDSPGKLAHGDARLLSHRHCQGPDGSGLVDHHQQALVIGQLLVESTQALLVVR